MFETLPHSYRYITPLSFWGVHFQKGETWKRWGWYDIFSFAEFEPCGILVSKMIGWPFGASNHWWYSQLLEVFCCNFPVIGNCWSTWKTSAIAKIFRSQTLHPKAQQNWHPFSQAKGRSKTFCEGSECRAGKISHSWMTYMASCQHVGAVCIIS